MHGCNLVRLVGAQDLPEELVKPPGEEREAVMWFTRVLPKLKAQGVPMIDCVQVRFRKPCTAEIYIHFSFFCARTRADVAFPVPLLRDPRPLYLLSCGHACTTSGSPPMVASEEPLESADLAKCSGG